ncbi:MAG: long-chain acyl-CoA synthetase, partial [Alteromonadaceae bacterium]
YQEFVNEIERYVAVLDHWQAKSVALLGDNSIQWVLVDFACQLLNIPLLPLPAYFTTKQLKHSVKTAACDLLLTDIDGAEQLAELLSGEVLSEKIDLYRAISMVPASRAIVPPGTSKITFTSGSTGYPKGVCLSQQQQWQVATSLKMAIDNTTDSHLCLLPLPTLLENVAGIYAAMLNGATVVIPSLGELGFSGSSSLDFSRFLGQISAVQPSSLITTPEILSGMVIGAEQGWPVPQSLSFVAVGGSRVSPGLTARTQKVGIPAYQGYGLSECASVVSLNTATQSKVPTAGKVLAHTKVAIVEGEVIVNGPLFLGYADDKDSWGQSSYATGDMGHVDDNGYLTITGRKKNLLISSFGRNINPEWVESELLSSSLIRQAFVFGDAKPFCVAALNPLSPTITPVQIDDWIQQINSQLPDYAQVKGWFLLPQPLLPGSDLLTSNGRPKRDKIVKFYAQDIERLYQVKVSPLSEILL